jgi:hypothetical protein
LILFILYLNGNGFLFNIFKGIQFAILNKIRQLEIPEAREMPSNYDLVGKRKGYKRYLNSELRTLNDNLTEAEVRRDEFIVEATRLVFEDFDKRFVL